jgi:hypothetical protein
VTACIGDLLHSADQGARFFANYFTTNVHDRDLLRLEFRRGEALKKAIARVMPELPIGADAAVTAFRAQLTGSILLWLGLRNSESKPFLLERTRDWLQLVGIPFNEQLIRELSASRPAANISSVNAFGEKRSRGRKRTVRL